MIAERHYDDEALIALLAGGNLDASRDPHIALCGPCSENLASYRAITEVLGDEAAWDLRDLRTEPAADTLEALRSFAAAAAAEETAAAVGLELLLDRPEDEWTSAAGQSAALQTPAIVQSLVERSEAVLHTVPVRALALARLAAHVAALLIEEEYPRDVVARSRGAAGRQLAYAAFYTGDYPHALVVLEQAQKAFQTCVVSDYDLGRVAIVRSLVFAAQDRYEEAIADACWAASVFQSFGDRSRYAAARSAEAFSLLSQVRYREALPILETIERDYYADLDNMGRAGAISNLAVCCFELGRLAEALDHFQVASAIYDEIGIVSEAARIRYNIASLLARHGRQADASARFRAVRAEFSRLGMPHMAVSAGLELAELLIAEQSYAEAETLCTEALDQFSRTGLSSTGEAMTALVFLREAAAQRRATPEAARHVRKYLENLPKQPDLLFAPPPLP